VVAVVELEFVSAVTPPSIASSKMIFASGAASGVKLLILYITASLKFTYVGKLDTETFLA